MCVVMIGSPASEARFRYRLGLNQPAGSPTVKRITEMAEAIHQETGGELLIEVFPESRLGPDPKMFADLRSGALEHRRLPIGFKGRHGVEPVEPLQSGPGRIKNVQ